MGGIFALDRDPRPGEGFVGLVRQHRVQPRHQIGPRVGQRRAMFAHLRLQRRQPGRIGSARLLSAASVRELTRDQVAGLSVERQRSAAPHHTHDFVFMDGSQKFGLGVLIETRSRPTGRAAGNYRWAGIYNTYFWVDTRASLAAVVLTQQSPFCAPQSIQICDAIDASAYESFASRERAITYRTINILYGNV